jgi:hypothetical protein
VPAQGNGHTLVLWSWSGRQIDTIQTGADYPIVCCSFPAMAPDGQRLLIWSSTGQTAEILTSAGRVVASGADLTQARWGDDSRHLCALRYGLGDLLAGRASLVIIDPGYRTDVVGTVPGSNADHTGVDIAACDVTQGVVVLLSNTMSVTTVIYVTIANDAQHDASWSDSDVAALSGNGLYAAGQNGKIIDTKTGQVVAHVEGQPFGLSWLGHVVLMTTGDISEAFDWQTGKVLWQAKGEGPPPCRCNSPTVLSSSRPGTDEMALNVEPVGSQIGSIWLVSPGGASRIASDVAFLTP